ncbi:MAG: acyloxyacyl hydrolase [Gammaproteobacteria bacterium]|nr:acyloxyacyl hydrolase [Gammaproteobacteria bacterium]MDH5727966.1 acyloxyacyl hydrolase [Gammaproteobacteria bacterium]
MNSKNSLILLTLISLSLFSVSVSADYTADRIAMDVGTSNKGVHIARAILQWDWRKREDSQCFCDLSYIEVDVSHWKPKTASIGESYLTDIGIKPVFRLDRPPLAAWFKARPFLEGGVGIHYLSAVNLPNTRFYTSTQFQFGEHFAWGFSFKNGLELSQRFLHLSNGAIRKPNPGINYKIIHASLRF